MKRLRQDEPRNLSNQLIIQYKTVAQEESNTKQREQIYRTNRCNLQRLHRLPSYPSLSSVYISLILSLSLSLYEASSYFLSLNISDEIIDREKK